MPAKLHVPAYWHFKPRNLAVVRIRGKDKYLGEFDSPASWEKYHRLIAELHAAERNGHVLPPINNEGDSGHGREPRSEKNVLGLEDHGQVPPELQRQVHATVEQTKERGGWSAKRTLAGLGISRGSYYRWLKEEAWAKEQADVRPVQAFEALPM